MKRKTMALMLALSMCLSLLTACGSGGTATDEKPPESENAASSTEQPKESEKPEETEDPKEEEPEESPEPTQEEPKEEDNAGTAFLKLLQEEYKTGFVEGERPGCTYYKVSDDVFAFISDGVVYIWDWKDLQNAKVFSYDIAAKKLEIVEIGSLFEEGGFLQPILVMNDTVCYTNGGGTIKTSDYNGVWQKTVSGYDWGCFDKGILSWNEPDNTLYLYSYDLEKIAEIPTTVQREAAHGLKEDVPINFGNRFAAGGTVYVPTNEGSNKEWYRLNTDTYEWEKCESQPYSGSSLYDFCGKYGAREDGIYDRVTGEQIFAYGELYAPVCVADKGDSRNCYFGGDKYLGSNRSEYRWINLTDLSMSDPLPFPKKEAGDYAFEMYILNDTYCVYKDKYGWFLWNYNTGEEETIYMFEQ